MLALHDNLSKIHAEQQPNFTQRDALKISQFYAKKGNVGKFHSTLAPFRFDSTGFHQINYK